MPKALSFDLRSRVLAAIDEGLSCRQAATRFGVSASSAIRWQAQRRAGGDARPKPQGGDRLSRRTECLVAGFDGALFSSDWKDALWAKFFMGAPARRRRCVERSNRSA